MILKILLCEHICLHLTAVASHFSPLLFREIEEELEMVWQAATRENQQMKATLFDSKVNANLHSWRSDEAVISPKHQPHGSEPLIFTSNQSPGLQKRAVLKSGSDDQNNALDETHKNGLDFYC